MAKSALEAINGCNLFGEKGASWSVIYVDIDAHNRNRSIFETLLPKESSSKVSNSSKLSVLILCIPLHSRKNKVFDIVFDVMTEQPVWFRINRMTEERLPKKIVGRDLPRRRQRGCPVEGWQ